jgi:hypothetical protein
MNPELALDQEKLLRHGFRTPSVSSRDRNFFLETVAREGTQR